VSVKPYAYPHPEMVLKHVINKQRKIFLHILLCTIWTDKGILIAMYDHSKSVTGQLEESCSGFSLWYQSNKMLVSIGKLLTGYLCSLRHISPYWEGFTSIWLSKMFIGFHQV
jgi:hypothetical protein